MHIDEQGGEIVRSFRIQQLGDPRPWVRLHTLLCTLHNYSFAFAVMRREALEQIRPYQPIVNGDLVMLAELVLRGPFAEPEEHLFANRSHPHRLTARLRGPEWKMLAVQWFGGESRQPPT